MWPGGVWLCRWGRRYGCDFYQKGARWVNPSLPCELSVKRTQRSCISSTKSHFWQDTKTHLRWLTGSQELVSANAVPQTPWCFGVTQNCRSSERKGRRPGVDEGWTWTRSMLWLYYYFPPVCAGFEIMFIFHHLTVSVMQLSHWNDTRLDLSLQCPFELLTNHY